MQSQVSGIAHGGFLWRLSGGELSAFVCRADLSRARFLGRKVVNRLRCKPTAARCTLRLVDGRRFFPGSPSAGRASRSLARLLVRRAVIARVGRFDRSLFSCHGSKLPIRVPPNQTRGNAHGGHVFVDFHQSGIHFRPRIILYVPYNTRPTVWAFEDINTDWLAGGRLAVPPDAVVDAFTQTLSGQPQSRSIQRLNE